MTVRVVGVDPTKVMQVSCGHCASRLEYTNSDVQKRIYRDYTGSADEVRYVKCPACGHEVHVR